MSSDDLTGKRVIILAGPHTGQEGTCMGRSVDGVHWAVSPDDSNEILQLCFEEEFGILITFKPSHRRRES